MKHILQILFNASGNQLHQEILGIDVEDRSPEVHPKGIPVELVGESCIPGINAEDVEGIFEEHAIKKEIDHSCSHCTVYAKADKVGTTVLRMTCRCMQWVIVRPHAWCVSWTTLIRSDYAPAGVFFR
jgi:hypothetical protein